MPDRQAALEEEHARATAARSGSSAEAEAEDAALSADLGRFAAPRAMPLPAPVGPVGRDWLTDDGDGGGGGDGDGGGARAALRDVRFPLVLSPAHGPRRQQLVFPAVPRTPLQQPRGGDEAAHTTAVVTFAAGFEPRMLPATPLAVPVDGS